VVWRWRRWVAVASAVGVVVCVPGVAGASPMQLREELDRTRSDLTDAELHLSSVEAEAAAAREALAATEAALDEAVGELEALRGRLTAAVAAHEAALERLAQASEELRVAGDRLRREQDHLQEQLASLGVQLNAAYRNRVESQVVGTMKALSVSRNVAEFSGTVDRLRFGTNSQQQRVDEIGQRLVAVEDARGQVEALRNKTRDEEDAARGARDHVEALTVQQEALVDQVRTQRREREALVARLDEARQEHQQVVDTLAAESEALATQLRAYRWVAGGGTGELVWPTDGRVTSGFGSRRHPIFGTTRLHAGVDIPAPTGQAVVSSAAGIVVSAGYRGGYGLAVVVDHGGGLATLYAHLSSVSVGTGQRVSQGDHVGAIGSTGQSTGPHLHYEVRRNGAPTDPLTWF
jgi:murein DD-endopeptidase MepM/ murein hydrolase activator NlpD